MHTEIEISANHLIPGTEQKHSTKQPTIIMVADRLPAMHEHIAKALHNVIPDQFNLMRARDDLQATSIAQSHLPALAIIECSLPANNGIHVANILWNIAPQAKVLFTFSSVSELYLRAINGIVSRNSIYGLVLKHIECDELTYAIDSLLSHDNIYMQRELREAYNRIKNEEPPFSASDIQTLYDVALGLTDRAISVRHHLTVRGVQSRIASLFMKLVHNETEGTKSRTGIELINPRTRLIFQAIKRGLLDVETLTSLEDQFQ
jgi:DNA-binding NarL/FixJ family response regulator